MKIQIKDSVPTPDEITAGLEFRTLHPALTDAELTERQRAQDLDDARAHLSRTIAALDAMAGEVQAGRAAAAELDEAIRQRQAAALAIGAAEARLAEATASREHGERVARQKLQAEALRRNEQLERLAAALSPALEAIVDAELALDVATRRALLADSSGLPAVEWPHCLRDRHAPPRLVRA